MRVRRLLLAATVAVTIAPAQRGVPSDWQAAMNRIRPESVRGHLSFLASDVLEGRATPSRGLDVAAEYIASQFRRAGIEPLPGGSYFQWLDLMDAAPDPDGFDCRIYETGRELPVRGVPLSKDGIDVDREPILPTTDASLNAPGAVVVYRGATDKPREVMKALTAMRAKLVIVVDPSGLMARSAMQLRPVLKGSYPQVPDGRWLFVDSFPTWLAPEARISVKARPVVYGTRPSRNVVGLLRGNDPKLRDTYVVVSAHYDHEGRMPFGSGDVVFNGANDDASGVTGVLEIAAALAALPERPKRSILFVTFAGEEDGLLGSKEFVKRPPVPRGSIVANLNFEHLGRPDADGTSYIGKAPATGFDFSTLGPTLAAAGAQVGIEFYKHPRFSDPFFAASDNLPFAEAGIPSLTVCHGFIFPEYHAPGDQWEKINVDSMTHVVRALALGTLHVADSAEAPRWNETNEKASKYRESAGK